MSDMENCFCDKVRAKARPPHQVCHPTIYVHHLAFITLFQRMALEHTGGVPGINDMVMGYNIGFALPQFPYKDMTTSFESVPVFIQTKDRWASYVRLLLCSTSVQPKFFSRIKGTGEARLRLKHLVSGRRSGIPLR
jgi:hypothetical protein